jgi:hypothetical protein
LLRHEHSVQENRVRARPSEGDCLSSLALEAWWLATTSRWRTTPALHRSPTKPVPCSRIKELSLKSLERTLDCRSGCFQVLSQGQSMQ